MLTKEECEKAYNNLYDGSYDVGHDFQVDYDVIEKLINEHFDNPPLKFEELHDKMWVWDNNEKEYVKCSPNKNLLGERCVWFWWSDFNPDGEYEEDYLIFEENRFYRYEVKEDD